MTSIKVKYKNDIRRVTIPLPLSYDKLREILNVLFSHTPNFPQHYGIKYVDDEGDHISITTDLELEEACSFSKRSGSAILRMFVVPTNEEGAEGTDDQDKPRLIDFEHNPAQPSSVFTHSQLVSIDQILKASSEPPCPSISSSSSVASNSCPNASPSLKKELSCPDVKPDEPAKPATPSGSISSLPNIPAPLPGTPYNAIFVADVGIQDGQTVAPGTEITKAWKIKNTGSSPWPEGVRLVNTLGDAMGPSTTPIINLAKPGETVEVSATLKVPNNAGRYVSYFRFHTPEGVPFGHRIWADVIVEEVEKQDTGTQMDVEPVEPVVQLIQPVVQQPVQPQPVHVPAPAIQPVVQPIPAVVAQPQPVHIPAPQLDPIEEKINILVQMGFYNRDKNREMLQKAQFNVEEAIGLLLGD